MLKLRRIALDSAPENIAVLSRRCTVYRAEEFRALRKIEVTGDGRQVLATLMIADDGDLVAPDELGLAVQAFRRFGLPEGATVTIAQATPPASLEAVRAKIDGRTLTPDQIDAVIRDIADHRYSPMEIAAWLISSASFLTTDEMLSVTRAMAKVGNRLSWNMPLVVDKHCIGGIPGNRTSMIVVPIVAAHGLTMPKTSSRAITSPAGTADTMEVLARVDLTIGEMQRVVEREKGCLVWGGHVNLSPADDVLISVERPLSIDTREQMVASILSKKLAAGSTHLLIDIPIGPTAKVRGRHDAVRLRKMFEYVGDQVGLSVEVIFTDGSQPIGRGIGPVLEARDVMAVLRNAPDAPADLRDRALLLAGRVLDFDPGLRGGAGHARASELLGSGQALAAMERIIAGQGQADTDWTLGDLTWEVRAPRDGIVSAIDCHRLARIARLAGAPIDKGAGIDLLKKIGERVRDGEPVYRIHSCVASDFDFARALAAEGSGIGLGDTPPVMGG
ncbi:MAG: thymidine phosphorylase family protein [Alphaproteobacteria bacterium]